MFAEQTDKVMFGARSETQKVANAQLAKAYQPILRGCFCVVSIYYGIMLTSYIFSLQGSDLIQLGGVAFIASVFAGSSYLLLRNPISVGVLEGITSAVNLLIFINVLVALNVEYNQAKLMYFIMMSMIFAFAKVTVRQAILSILVAQSGLFAVVWLKEPDQLGVYGFIGFAATLSSVAVTYFLQRGIGLAVAARQDADKARSKAEERLETAEKLGEKMRQQSLSDSLTALPNRRAFFEALAENLDQRRDINTAWLILIDLDGFKAVNDNYGHLMGDRLLKAVARRLREYCGYNAHVSRMGGDEFNIILTGCENEEQVEAWCQVLLEKIAKVYLIEDRLIQISASAGCYQPEAGEEDTRLMQRADYALLHAKRSGKNRVVVFRSEHARDSAERFSIEQALRQANFSNEIELLFQPQFDLTLGRAVCVEALARWHSPVLGTIPPDRFIKTAEESGLIANITLAVLDKALAQSQAWLTPIPLSINLSGQDLTSDHIINQIINRIGDSGVTPEHIEFEVTETAMMPDTERAAANLKRLSELGHPISLDDFGTGYSNFSYLRTLPISKLKVDRSFMENIADPMTEKVLSGLVGMARTLGVHCLLEGIETELDLLIAKRVGAQSIQGYLFGVPMTANDIEAHFKVQSALESVRPPNKKRRRAGTA